MINVLNDSGLKYWVSINDYLGLVNDKRLAEVTFSLELVLTINDQGKLLFWLIVPNYAKLSILRFNLEKAHRFIQIVGQHFLIR